MDFPMRLRPAPILLLALAALSPAQTSAPAATILEIRTITPKEEPYSGWPTVVLRANGDLWSVWSGGRDAHVCPMGQVRAMTSKDGGATWSYPRVLLDTATDDRDAGVLETAKGTLLVTTFTSLAYEPYLKRAQSMGELKSGGWKAKPMPPDQLARWTAAHARLDDAARQAELGEWIIRSTDGGLTWSPRIPTVVNSPHGPIRLKDGRLLYPGKELWTGSKRIGVAESLDDGLTWKWLAGIPTRPGDEVPTGYHELHGVETDDGRIIVQIRNHNKANAGETLQCESSDGGRTWTVPAPIGVWGLPSHLLKLHDGRLLMTYGHRRAPWGNQARVSADHGRTWSAPIILNGEGAARDLGYPSTVQLADGTLLSVWYEKLPDASVAVLRQARWKLD
jgi:sialidase-1